MLARSLPDGLATWLPGLTAVEESKPSVKDADERQSSDRTIEACAPKKGQADNKKPDTRLAQDSVAAAGGQQSQSQLQRQPQSRLGSARLGP